MSKVFYNFSGKPIALYDGDYVYNTGGEATLFRYEDALYKIDTGEPVGIIAEGIIYNWDKKPQAWTEGCRLALLSAYSDLWIAPPKPRIGCEKLSNFATKEVPSFLLEKFGSNHLTAFKNGLFQ